MGHACSAVTLANLARIGNKDVLTRYSTKNLAPAARAVTLAATNMPVAARQIVYGPRAVEAVFGFSGIVGGTRDPTMDFNGDGVIDEIDHFTLAEFLGVEEPPVRITTLASNGLVAQRLGQCFGEDPLFTEEAGGKLLERIKKDLESNLEREYTSPVGLAILWDSVFGSFTPEMKKVMDGHEKHLGEQNKLMDEAEAVFRNYIQEDDSNSKALALGPGQSRYRLQAHRLDNVIPGNETIQIWPSCFMVLFYILSTTARMKNGRPDKAIGAVRNTDAGLSLHRKIIEIQEPDAAAPPPPLMGAKHRVLSLLAQLAHFLSVATEPIGVGGLSLHFSTRLEDRSPHDENLATNRFVYNAYE
jgi:hypothetical protein